MELFSPTGGLRWHFRALLRRHILWKEFRAQLDRFLGDWDTGDAGTLVLIAPSGGYTLPPALLRRFDTIVAIDREPLALLIFRLRWSLRVRSRIVTRCADALGIVEGRPVDSSCVSRILAEYPDAAVLFCNVLGQMRFVLEDADEHEGFARWRADVRGLLAGRAAPWASYHERWSGEPMPAIVGRQFGANGEDPLPFENLYPEGGEVLDHLTEDLLPPESRRAWLRWRFDLVSWHLVEVATGPLKYS
jgi:hypothetical protein